MITATILWKIGSAIIGLMGLMHLRGALFTNKLYPKNETAIKEMKNSSLIMTSKLNLWKSWIGFNATHGIGAAFVGLINFYLAYKYPEFLFSDKFILVSGILVALGYTLVSYKYWFKLTTLLIAFASILLIMSFTLSIFLQYTKT